MGRIHSSADEATKLFGNPLAPVAVAGLICVTALIAHQRSVGIFSREQAPPEPPCPHVNQQLPASASPSEAFCAATMKTLIASAPGTQWPPPCPPPAELREAFEGPDGSQPITKDYCFASAGEGTVKHWDYNYVEKMRADLRSGSHPGSYTHAEVEQIRRLLSRIPQPFLERLV
jgi:hypothetical protein